MIRSTHRNFNLSIIGISFRIAHVQIFTGIYYFYRIISIFYFCKFVIAIAIRGSCANDIIIFILQVDGHIFQGISSYSVQHTIIVHIDDSGNIKYDRLTFFYYKSVIMDLFPACFLYEINDILHFYNSFSRKSQFSALTIYRSTVTALLYRKCSAGGTTDHRYDFIRAISTSFMSHGYIQISQLTGGTANLDRRRSQVNIIIRTTIGCTIPHTTINLVTYIAKIGLTRSEEHTSE